MSKKFYLVKDEVNPATGGYYPYKVLNYYPVQPMIQPMPIKKSSGLTIPLGTPSIGMNIIPTYGMNSTYGVDFYNSPQFNLSGKVDKPRFVSAAQPIIIGPPIMKYNTFGPQVNGLIKIMFGSNVVSLNIPYVYFRKVVNDIYYRAFVGLNPTEAKITVRIIGLGVDTSIQTTLTKILEIIKYINATYSNIGYDFNGVSHSYDDMYVKLG
jgi:hypothetical protein